MRWPLCWAEERGRSNPGSSVLSPHRIRVYSSRLRDTDRNTQIGQVLCLTIKSTEDLICVFFPPSLLNQQHLLWCLKLKTATQAVLAPFLPCRSAVSFCRSILQQHQNPRLDVASHKCSTRNPVRDSCSSSHAHKLFRDATTSKARKHLLQLPFLSPSGLFPAEWGQNHVAWKSQIQHMKPTTAGAQALTRRNTSKQLSHLSPTLCFLALILSIGRWR